LGYLVLRNAGIRTLFFVFLLSQVTQVLPAQDRGLILLRVQDAISGLPLPEATVTYNRSKSASQVKANGELVLPMIDGPYSMFVSAPGYVGKRVGVEVVGGVMVPLDVYLMPDTGLVVKDSLLKAERTGDSSLSGGHTAPGGDAHRLRLVSDNACQNTLSAADISEGVDRDLSWIMRRAGGTFLSPALTPSLGEGLVISGMGERYNQLLVNGMPAIWAGTTGRRYLTSVFPSEAIEQVSVNQWGNAALPADFAGGQVNLRWKDIPAKDFTTVQAGASFLQGGGDAVMTRSPWSATQWMGIPTAFRAIPDGFPDTRSRSPLAGINLQEKADLLEQLPNGLEAETGTPFFSGTRFLFGIGRRYKDKNDATWGFTAHLLHQTKQQSGNASLTFNPDLSDNPYPFSAAKPLALAYTTDQITFTGSSLSFAVGSAVSFRRNIIRLHLQAVGALDEVVTERSDIHKPDEDTVANIAQMYQPNKLGLISTQLSGEHALGNGSRLQLTWQVTYSFSKPEKPDERHFLLRDYTPGGDVSVVTPLVTPVPDRNNVGNAALAANLDAIFPNSYRLWESAKDHQFAARAGMRFPFQFLGRSHVMDGGLFMQTHYREQYADRLMYWGGRPGSPESVIGEGQYYPGGVNVEAYYSKIISSAGFFQVSDLQEDNLGNYTGSLNNGAAYLQYAGYLLPGLVLDLGLRAESSSRLVSSTEYNYFELFKKPRLTTLNENATVSRFDLLPLVSLRYEPLKNLILQASYFETVNHPQMQELAPYRYYDPASFVVYKGNPFLTSSRIRHIVAGISWHSARGTGFYAAFFHRNLEQPIEEVVSGFPGSQAVSMVTPYNMPDARVTGVRAGFELPFSRKGRSLWSYVSVRAGGVLTQSEVESGPLRSGFVPEVTAHRLVGTPDYTAYGGLVVNHPSGFGFSAIYQAIGPRLHAVGSGQTIIPDGNKAVLAVPHYQENERSEINIQLSWSMFKKHLSVVCGADNLFRTPYILYQDLNGDGKFGDALRVTPMSGGGRYESGQDNVLRRVDQTPGYYFRLMYTW